MIQPPPISLLYKCSSLASRSDWGTGLTDWQVQQPLLAAYLFPTSWTRLSLKTCPKPIKSHQALTLLSWPLLCCKPT